MGSWEAPAMQGEWEAGRLSPCRGSGDLGGSRHAEGVGSWEAPAIWAVPALGKDLLEVSAHLPKHYQVGRFQ